MFNALFAAKAPDITTPYDLEQVHMQKISESE